MCANSCFVDLNQFTEMERVLGNFFAQLHLYGLAYSDRFREIMTFIDFIGTPTVGWFQVLGLFLGDHVRKRKFTVIKESSKERS